MTEKQYGKMVKDISPKSPILKNCLKAFVVGGLICTLGQGLINLYSHWGLGKEDASTAASLTLVALSALFTGLSLYDNLAKHAGAGTLVPITGFANAVSSAAVEFKTEGFILGVGAKMFTIAGRQSGQGQKSSAAWYPPASGLRSPFRIPEFPGIQEGIRRYPPVECPGHACPGTGS